MSASIKRAMWLLSLCITGHNALGQSLLLPAPIQDSTQRILILEKLNSGKRDTIYQGSYVKLWVRTERKHNKLQPLTRMDFNRHTVYYESTLITVNDSLLVLLKRTPPPFIKMRSLFDTISLKQVFAIRGFNKDVEIATTSGITMPAIPFVPSDLLTFPWMFAIVPVSQTVTQISSGIINPMRRLKRKNNQRYQLLVGEKNIDSVYNVIKAPAMKGGQYEWEIDKYKRREKSYNRASKILDQRLIANNTGNNVYSFTMGSMFFPGYVRGTADVKTKVRIADNSFVFGFTSERYISSKDRVGLEIQFNIPPRTTSLNGASFSAGAGYINSFFSFAKIGIGGLYSKKGRGRLLQKAYSINPDTADLNAQKILAGINARLRMKPKTYFLFGIGKVNTTLVRVKGSMSTGSISITDYSQKKISVQSGFGISSRLSRRLLYDMSVKYIWSPDYRPSIGGLNSYSGFKIQFAVGYMSGRGFALRRKMLNEVAMMVK